MSTTTASSLQIGTLRNCKFSCPRGFKGVVTPTLGGNLKAMSWAKLRIVYNVSSLKYFQLNSTTSSSTKFGKISTQAMSGSSENTPVSGLPVDLKGNRAFIAGVAVDNGYGWAIAKSLAAAGAEIIVGTWVPALNIFESSLRRGKFDKSRALPDGSLMEITKIYPLDAVFDNPEDVPEIKTNKRYAGSTNWTVQVAPRSLLHTLLLKGSFLDMEEVLAFEAGRKSEIRVNTISAGPLRSRAAKAIGFIDMMIDYWQMHLCRKNYLQSLKIGSTEKVGNAAAFLASPLASAITGSIICIDNGLNTMGVGVDSPTFEGL